MVALPFDHHVGHRRPSVLAGVVAVSPLDAVPPQTTILSSKTPPPLLHRGDGSLCRTAGWAGPSAARPSAPASEQENFVDERACAVHLAVIARDGHVLPRAYEYFLIVMIRFS